MDYEAAYKLGYRLDKEGVLVRCGVWAICRIYLDVCGPILFVTGVHSADLGPARLMEMNRLGIKP